MPPAHFWYVKAFAMKHMVLYSSFVPITRLARKCQRRGTDAAGVLLVRQGICDEAYGALSTDWNYLPGKNGQTIGITIRDTMKHTITRPQPAFR